MEYHSGLDIRALSCIMAVMERMMRPGKAATFIGVSVKTLQRWAREGRVIPAARTESNRRRSAEEQLRACIG